jgi:hypothetical protein
MFLYTSAGNELFTSLLSLESVTVLEIRDANLTKYSEQGNILSVSDECVYRYSLM